MYHRMLLEVYAGNIDEFLYKTLCVVSYAIAFSRRCQWDYEFLAYFNVGLLILCSCCYS